MTSRVNATTLSLSSMVEAIAGGELLPSAIADSCLRRIEEREASVRAWKHIDADRLRARAAALDHVAPMGLLHGIPIGIKDVIDTVDMPTGYGSEFYEGFQPAANAAAVSRLCEAGAIIAGKTITTEFASVAPPVTRNPHNLDHTPGGSSSGSAAAVAAGMIPAALGTQTAGSVVRPAAYCGVVGYKPSFGLVDRTGVKTLAQSFDTVGTFARTVEDVALVTSVLACRPALRELAPQRQPRIGLFLPPWCALGQQCASDVVRHVASVLRAAGHRVDDIDWIDGFDTLLAAQEAVMDWDMTQALSFELDHGAGKLHPVTERALGERRNRASPQKVDAAFAHFGRVTADLCEVFSTCDALIVPSAPGEAPRGHHNTGSSEFNRGWTALGVPCINLPAGTGPNGLPLGVQLISRRGQDQLLLSVARQVEAAMVGNSYGS